MREFNETLLSVENISLSFGAVKALTNISFEIKKGEILAIIGPNGAGKTSMLNVINGFYHPQEGVITFRGEKRRQMKPFDAARQGIARTFQNVALFKGMSTLDNIMTGRNLKMKSNILSAAFYLGPAKREEIEHRAVVEEIIDFLEIQAIRKTPVGRLPYGLQKRVELGRALMADPEVFLVDEPTAGLAPKLAQEIRRHLRELTREGKTVILVEQNIREAIEISDYIYVLDLGRNKAEGPREAFQGDLKALIKDWLF